ncbi:hypothetical protein F4703DRAFT_1838856 [Phycomyces blakesleeanus]
MCDLNWCPSCDKAISPDSKSLYCSMTCLQQDALNKNPLLGYDFSDFRDFLPPLKNCHYNNTYVPESELGSDTGEEDEDEEEEEEDRDTLQTPDISPSHIVEFSSVPNYSNSFTSYKKLLDEENKNSLCRIWGNH